MAKFINIEKLLKPWSESFKSQKRKEKKCFPVDNKKFLLIESVGQKPI